MDRDGFMSVQKGKYNMNTLITWNQLREMEKAAQNRFNRFLGGRKMKMPNFADPIPGSVRSRPFGISSSGIRRFALSASQKSHDTFWFCLYRAHK
jgi:hypothetical protein